MDNNEFVVTSIPSGESLLSVPETMLYHAVEDGELERLMKIERPVIAGVCLTFIGVAAGTFPQALEALKKASGSLTILPADMAYTVVFFVSLAVSVVTGIVAFTGQSGAQKALEAIRARPQIRLPLGHPAAPKSDKV